MSRGYYPNTEKRAVYPIPCLPWYSYRQHIFQYRGGYYPRNWKMRRLSYPLSTIILIETTFSSVEGATTPTLKNAPPILSPVYHHTHIDNTFSSIEGCTTPKLKNAPSILSPVYHHRDNIFQCRGGYYPNTEKSAVYPIPCLPSYSYRQHIFQYRRGYYPETEKCAYVCMYVW